MTEDASREIYNSSNGDRWVLVGNGLSRNIVVRHIPAPSSGGKTSETDLGAFLSSNAASPQGQNLLQMIWALLEDPD